VTTTRPRSRSRPSPDPERASPGSRGCRRGAARGYAAALAPRGSLRREPARSPQALPPASATVFRPSAVLLWNRQPTACPRNGGRSTPPGGLNGLCSFLMLSAWFVLTSH
jgi:hypothetical protein